MHPDIDRKVKDEGEEVDEKIYWHRALRSGDLELSYVGSGYKGTSQDARGVSTSDRRDAAMAVEELGSKTKQAKDVKKA